MSKSLNMSVIALALLASAPAAAVTLVSNLSAPIRSTTDISGQLWATQSFTTGPGSWSLDTIRTVLGGATGTPGAFAQLRRGSSSGTVLTSFTLPDLTGPQSIRTLNPLANVTLTSGETYFLIVGATGSGSFGWSYAEGNAATGPGALDRYEYSFDQGGLWANFGTDNPYLMEVNASRTAVPEPSTWAMLVVGFALGGALLRTRRRVESRRARAGAAQ